MRRLQAIAQNGLHYSDRPYERQRYEEVLAVAAELAATELEPLEPLAATFASMAGHACPRIDVRAAAFRDGEVLLVRGTDDGLWTLPGGWAETGESPRRAAEKELREESGYTGSAAKLIGLWEQDSRDRPRWPFYGWKIYLLCDLEDGEPGAVDEVEVAEVGFFAEGSLPELSRRTSPHHLAIAFAHARDRFLPAAFD